MTHVLDYPVWAALTGRQVHLAQINGQAARYHPQVAPFAALRPAFHDGAWSDLAGMAGPGAVVVLPGATEAPPPDWQVVDTIEGMQMIAVGVPGAADPEAVRLGPADVPDMLNLVARTEPGPFHPRTIQLGTYLGIRRRGALVAMAGERMRPPGWTEISAVCTDPAHRGQGLASRLVRALAAVIQGRGETPFLHATTTNVSAIRLYRSLGFTTRRTTPFAVLRVPDGAPATAP